MSANSSWKVTTSPRCGDGSFGRTTEGRGSSQFPIRPERFFACAYFPPENCSLAGFLGVELYTQDAPEDSEEQPRFIFCGSTGNPRENNEGELIGDGIYCLYPAEALDEVRLLDYVPPPAHGQVTAFAIRRHHTGDHETQPFPEVVPGQ
jgi:hypothetical protein